MRKRSYMVQLFAVVLVSVLLAGCGDAQNQGGNEMPEATNENVEQPPNNESNIAGENIASAMLKGEAKQLYAQFSSDLQGIVTEQDFISLVNEFTAGVAQFELASTMDINGYRSYVWSDAEQSKGLTAIVDEQNTIAGFQVLPLTSYPDTDQLYSTTTFQLPFADEWLVFWGGKNVFLNYHYEYEHVRYAYDFIKVKDGYSYDGDPTHNESYYAFGAEVLAPAGGVVVEVVDGIEDNIPGQMNEQQPAGNIVVIEHQNGEFSELAHFKKDSIVVQVGDTVKAGQLLGECGNSGNSSEPHIHFQVYKKNEDSSGLVIPVAFADGKEWVRGELAAGNK
ncbi:M23 family metallopeptidase [Paenibacillus montaniterrae]|uniref:M23 family metallopeptidase n=1 Tax=Paenibacillus montaniterrae TaxID=429341 RepID=A0A919YRE1_9BACL|nr:M23 family metallopeptidase [Paenibacillus montaniterrae]GIP17877.1 M23 family metallopeptidase [Paenibacillus montaniterrae]